MCTVDDCDRRIYARGHCERHYRQLLRRGSIPAAPAPPPVNCKVQTCERRAVTRGWCHGHYLRWRRTGEVAADRLLARPTRAACAVPGCSQSQHGRGLCRTHLRRLDLLGHPAEDVPVRSPGDSGWLTHGYRGVVVPEDLRHLTGGAAHVLEHRLVMAVLLGRPLADGESVHHKNGDRLDNRPENLELWSSRQPAGQRAQDKLAFAYELIRLYDVAGWRRLELQAADTTMAQPPE